MRRWFRVCGYRTLFYVKVDVAGGGNETTEREKGAGVKGTWMEGGKRNNGIGGKGDNQFWFRESRATRRQGQNGECGKG